MGDIVADLGQANAATVALAAVSLLLLIGLRLFLPRFPAALLVVVLGIVASWSLDLAAHSVNVAGPVPAGLPEFAIPRVGGLELAQLAGVAGGILLVGISGRHARRDHRDRGSSPARPGPVAVAGPQRPRRIGDRRGHRATPMSAVIRTSRSLRVSSCIGSPTGCSSPTCTSSNAGCGRPWTRRPSRPGTWCSTCGGVRR